MECVHARTNRRNIRLCAQKLSLEAGCRTLTCWPVKFAWNMKRYWWSDILELFLSLRVLSDGLFSVCACVLLHNNLYNHPLRCLSFFFSDLFEICRQCTSGVWDLCRSVGRLGSEGWICRGGRSSGSAWPEPSTQIRTSSSSMTPYLLWTLTWGNTFSKSA